MGINIETRKVELIAFIAQLQQEEAISAIEKAVKQYTRYKNPEYEHQLVSETNVQYFKRPIRDNISIEDLVREQNWKPIDEAKMDAIAQKMDIKEPIELLMAQLMP